MSSSVGVIDWTQLQGFKQLQEEGEPDVVLQVIAMFQKDAPARLARAIEAAEREDCRSLRFEAHSLRGTAGLIGAAALREAAGAVEREAEANHLAAALGVLPSMARAVEDILTALAEAPF